MQITPEDVTEANPTLDSAIEAAWSTEDDAADDTPADETVVEIDSEDEDTDEAPDADEVDEPKDEVEDDTEPSDDNQRFTVKIDGEEVEVTLDEALAGYQRQADYTRKTQLLAQDREKYAAFDALSEALKANPADTLAQLSRLYGVELGTEEQDTPDPLEDLDPALAAEIREMRTLRQEVQEDRAQREAAERTRAVDAEIEALRTIDPSLESEDAQAELLKFAIDNGIPSLELAHELLSTRRAKTEANKPKVKAVAAKRKAPPVEGGANRSGVKKGASPTDMTFEAAFDAALAELG